MERKAVRGIPWSLGGYAATRLLTLATTIALARLLVPEEFGLAALALLVVSAIGVLSDLGLGSALVLRQDLDRRAQGTVLTLMVATALVLAAALAAASPVFAAALDEPRVRPVLTVLALALAVAPLAWFYEPLLVRELEFRRRFAAQVVQTGVYATTAIALAALGAGVWSLVVGHVAGTGAYGAALATLAPYRVRPRADGAVARDVLRTGRGFMAQGGLAFARQNADYLAVGRVLGAAPLGAYSLAYRLSEIPAWAVADPVARVTFAGFARMRSRGEDVGTPFLTALRLVALATCPAAVVLGAAAEPFTRAVLGERWLPAVGPLAVLGVWGALRPVQVTLGWLLNSVGEAGASAVVSAIAIGPLLVAVFLAADVGTTAVAAVMLAEVVVTGAAFAVLAQRRAGVPLARTWHALRPILAGGVAGWIAARAVATAAEDWPAWPALGASVAAGLVAYLVVTTALEPRLLRQAAAQASRAVTAR